MTPVQKTALEFWLSCAEFDNDFKPQSDQKTSDYLKSIGHNVSKSGIFKWRQKFNWQKELNLHIQKITSEDEKVRASLGEIANADIVAKTIVDLERNKALLSKGYEILELKSKLILEKYKITGKISNDDTKIALAITQLVANREDRMLDRSVVAQSLGKSEALKAIKEVAGAIEFDGEEIETEILQNE